MVMFKGCSTESQHGLGYPNLTQLAQEVTMTYQASQVGIVGAYSVHPSFQWLTTELQNPSYTV